MLSTMSIDKDTEMETDPLAGTMTLEGVGNGTTVDLTLSQDSLNMTDEDLTKFLQAFSMGNSRQPIERLMPIDGLRHKWLGYLALAYFCLFIIGIFGNTSVLTTLVQTLRKRKKHIRSPDSQQSRMLMSVIALIIVDLYVLLSLPTTISDMFLGHWLFGNVMCKMHWMVESSGKFMSIFILMTFSYDRYMTVCWPYSKFRIKKTRTTGIILSALVILTFSLLWPLIYYSQTIRQTVEDHLRTDIVVYAKTRCNLGFSPRIGFIFTTCACTLGFIVPGAMIFLSNIALLFKVYRHHTGMRAAQSCVSYIRVAWYTLGVCGFYALCWGPFWVTFFLIEFTDIEERAERWIFLRLMHILHALPYVSSSFNWVFYYLLNKEVQRMKQRLFEIEDALISKADAMNHSQSVVVTSQVNSHTTAVNLSRKRQFSPTMSNLTDVPLRRQVGEHSLISNGSSPKFV